MLERIRQNWLLILQVLFLVFVVLALARPSILLWKKSRSIAFVMDCSASMSVHEHGKTRLDLAREKARMLLDEVGDNDQVLFVQSRPKPVLTSCSGSDKSTLRRDLKNLNGTQAPVDLGQAFVMALSSVQETESHEVFIFSDGTQDTPLPGNNARVHYIQVGESDNNVAITCLSIRSNPFSRYDQEVYAEVVNFSDRPQGFSFDMSLEGASLIHETIKLGHKERKSFTAKAPSAGRGIVTASIDVKDDLEADNKAYAVLDPRKAAVLLVTTGNQFLEKALHVNPRVVCTIKRPEECSQDELRKQYDLIILDGFEPQVLPPANYFIIKHPSGAATESRPLMGEVKDPVSPWPRHPVMTFVNLGNIVIDQALPLEAPPSGSVLIEGGGKPLLTASENGAFRTVKLGFDVRSSNLPLTLSFPVLISNIVNWLSSVTDDSQNQISSGAILRWRMPDLEGNVTVTAPDGIVSRPSIVNGILSFPRTETTGIYTLSNGKTAMKFAVNLFSEQESNIKPVFKPANGEAHLSGGQALARAGREIWSMLLFVSLALLMLQWLHRW